MISWFNDMAALAIELISGKSLHSFINVKLINYHILNMLTICCALIINGMFTWPIWWRINFVFQLIHNIRVPWVKLNNRYLLLFHELKMPHRFGERDTYLSVQLTCLYLGVDLFFYLFSFSHSMCKTCKSLLCIKPQTLINTNITLNVCLMNGSLRTQSVCCAACSWTHSISQRSHIDTFFNEEEFASFNFSLGATSFEHIRLVFSSISNGWQVPIFWLK